MNHPLLALFIALALASGPDTKQGETSPIGKVETVENLAASGTENVSREQWESERQERREAERRAAVSEAKLELIDAANSRLEIMIGAFGILITVMIALAGFFTWRSAANAARSEVQAMRDELEFIRSKAMETKAEIDRLAQDATVQHTQILSISDNPRERANALPGQERSQSPTGEERDELAKVTEVIEARPEREWSANEYRLMLYDAQADGDWARYVYLAGKMAKARPIDKSDISFSLFAKAHGLSMLGKYEESSKSYEEYLEKCPYLSESDKASALSNWGNSLDEQAKILASKGNFAEADEIWNNAIKKYSEAIEIDSQKYFALYNWGNVLDEQARTKILTGDNEKAGELWEEAVKKYVSAIEINPDDHENLNNLGNTLIRWSHIVGKTERDKLLAQAEEAMHKANAIAQGSGSYNLACIASLREDAVTAARWLREGAEHDKNFPDCHHIRADPDFDSVRSSKEFQKALMNIGCGAEAVDTKPDEQG